MTQMSFIADDDRQQSKRPSEPIIRTAEIEDNYRWLLKRAWGAGACILWCGVNPSTADATRDDPTMWREIEFSHRWGFGSLIKVNIYPFIAADQKALRRWRASWRPNADTDFDGIAKGWQFDKSAINAYLHNMDIVREQLWKVDRLMAAWGNGAEGEDLREFLREVQTDYEDHRAPMIEREWYCLGTNADGSPRHTLSRGVHRVPDDFKPILWRKA